MALITGVLVVSLLTGTVKAGMGGLSTVEIEEQLQVSWPIRSLAMPRNMELIKCVAMFDSPKIERAQARCSAGRR